MARLLVCDDWITVDLEACGPVLAAALECDDAESIVKCAVLMALSALAQGGHWPAALFEDMTRFMSGMRTEVCGEPSM